MKILFIVGSLRKDSFNRQLAQEAKKIIGARAVVNYLEYSEVPFLNQDKEYPAPAAVNQVRQEVAEADGVWIFTPEYNRSYPAQVKNLLDWLSRPLAPNDYATPTAVTRKKMTLSGAGGQIATEKCREKLCELLTFIKADVMEEPQTGIALNMEAWTEGRMILSDEQKENLKKQADAFLTFVNA
jgi:chromate reductase